MPTRRYWDLYYLDPTPFTSLPVTGGELALLQEQVTPPDARAVVDISCGWGVLAAHLAHTGLQVSGYGWSGHAIVAARELVGSGLQLTFTERDFTHRSDPEAAPGSIDLAVAGSAAG
ncbi:hypothetical protein ACIPW5_25840 [Streptomyces sp. NPDC090077]|uniref:hypothetical protein n=1 Tax=Streptomyces sp. NPDC090077 TaxID=3365938 RepID=UPI0038160E86